MEFNRKNSTYTLTIEDATPEMQGKLTAVATNSGGEVFCEATLDVRGKAPTFVQTPLKCVILEGKEMKNAQ